MPRNAGDLVAGECRPPEGAVTFGKHRLTAGDYLCTPPAVKHAVCGRMMLLCVPELVILKNARLDHPSQ